MFGESDSESPRVPSPWDSLVSTPASYSPSPSPLAVARSATPSPAQLVPVLGPTQPSSPLTYPKLIPESDDGNIEYKLHLLSPSPARFARLVTQMKWRLLEGGGQAYYELGVSDSGLLVGMSHADLERSLETLEMMAGEIGASVIVVKEIEVPEKLVEMVNSGEVKEVDHRRVAKKEEDGFMFMLTSEDETTTTEDDEEDEREDTGHGDGVFDMDPVEPQQQFSIDIEIASVFKPRPVRTKLSAGAGLTNSATSSGNSSSGRDYKRNKKREKKDQKVKRDAFNGHVEDPPQKLSRREIRDRRREGKHSALQNLVQESLDANAENDELTSRLEALHVSVDDHSIQSSGAASEVVLQDKDVTATPTITTQFDAATVPTGAEEDDDDDVFPSVHSPATIVSARGQEHQRIIVEALVVRKMSLDEAFLDFGGFAVMSPEFGSW